MRIHRIVFASAVCIALPAAAQPPLEQSISNPAYADPAAKWESVDEAVAGDADTPIDPEICRDIINKARADAGQAPLLEPEPASPDKPHHIYAVDRREGGCSVMVMAGAPGGIRPLPAPMEQPVQPIPAKAKGQ